MSYYHTTKEQNETLTRVGPGTPMGTLLRRYWWPIAISEDLKDKPTLVRHLGEDLVLFRNKEGDVGLLDSKCAHRRASLCLGFVEGTGLRCRYHGWFYGTDGALIDIPGEPRSSGLAQSIRQVAYPTSELGGLIFAYLGPQPAPLLPRYHFLAAEGERSVSIQAFNDSNFLQSIENGMDPFHVSFLHNDVWTTLSAEPEATWFERTSTGCVYKAIRPGRSGDEYNYREQPFLMPAICITGDAKIAFGEDNSAGNELPVAAVRWAVPIDDTHTVNFRLFYRPKGQPLSEFESMHDPAFPIRVEPYKEQREGYPALGYDIPHSVKDEDVTMLDSIGPIADRENENLCFTDGGVALLRQCYLDDLAAVAAGYDPSGVIRDAEENKLIICGGNARWIDTNEKNRMLEGVSF